MFFKTKTYHWPLTHFGANFQLFRHERGKLDPLLAPLSVPLSTSKHVQKRHNLKLCQEKKALPNWFNSQVTNRLNNKRICFQCLLNRVENYVVLRFREQWQSKESWSALVFLNSAQSIIARQMQVRKLVFEKASEIMTAGCFLYLDIRARFMALHVIILKLVYRC